MNTIGLGCKRHGIVFALCSFLFISSYAEITSARTDQSTISASTLIEFGKKLIENINELHYQTAQEIIIPIPGIGQEYVINLGFAGSGDIFLPLPTVAVNLRMIPQATAAGSFSVADLAKALTQDTVIQQSKQYPLLSWLVNTHLTPFKIFCIKIFLLVKDLKQQEVSLPQTCSELLRLFIRLSMSQNSELKASTQPLSHYMPTFIKDFINKHAPEFIEVTDFLWSVINNPDPAGTVASLTTNLPRTIYACPLSGVTAEAAVSVYLETYERLGFDNFKNNKGVQIFRANTTTSIPPSLQEAATKVTKVPQLIKAKTDKGTYWIGYVTDRLGTIDTFKRIAALFLCTFKEYIKLHKVHYASNPQGEQTYLKQREEKQKKVHRLQEFLKTEYGKASTQRLQENLDRIEKQNQPVTQPHNTMTHQNKHLVGQSVETLNAQAHTIKQQIVMFKNAQRNASAEVAKNFQKRIDALTKQLNDLHLEEHQKQDPITAVTEQPVASINQSDKDHVSLQELKDLAAKLKKSGEPVPADVLNALKERENKQTPDEAITPQASFDLAKFLEIRTKKIATYDKEIELTNRECSKQRTIQESRGWVATQEFDLITKPQYEAYRDSLVKQATTMRKENEKIEKLLALQKTISTIQQEITPDVIASIKSLDREVQAIVSNQSNTFISTILTNNPEIEEFIEDLKTNEAYTSLKKTLLTNISLVMQKSDHIKDYANTYRYVLHLMMPEMLPTFETLMSQV